MPADHKMAFAKIRNYLAGRHLGATRDHSLLEEVTKCLFAYKSMLAHDVEQLSDPFKLAARYRDSLLGTHVPFAETDQLLLDPQSIEFIHYQLCELDLFGSDRDPVGDLYEAFIGSAARGSEGQFFTPLNAVEWLADAVGLKPGEAIIDPACGAGGFLMAAAKKEPSIEIFGVEKDSYLANLARARMDILGITSEIYCGNSLSLENIDNPGGLSHLIGEFDVVLTNPPFGKNIVGLENGQRHKFELSYRWKKIEGGYIKSNDFQTNVPPQVLFMERIISLLRDGGRAGVVVPESLLCGRSYAHVVRFLSDRAAIQAVVGMPEALFKHSGKGGTHTKTCLLMFTKGRQTTRVYMAEAAWCGHDSRGRKIDRDDLPTLLAEYKSLDSGINARLDLGYLVDKTELTDSILTPRYHEPTAQKVAGHLSSTHELISMGELLMRGEIEIATGNEIGKLAYGSGQIPFVRTSDISSWEIKADPKHLVSEEIYEKYKVIQDVKAGDILMVRDGTYLIGSCALVTTHDEKIVYQSHILKIRCTRSSRLNPFLLLALLSSDPVQQQIKAKTFTQDIINSLGNRLAEIALPIPRDAAICKKISCLVEKVIADRVEARELSRLARRLVVDREFNEYRSPQAQSILQ